MMPRRRDFVAAAAVLAPLWPARRVWPRTIPASTAPLCIGNLTNTNLSSAHHTDTTSNSLNSRRLCAAPMQADIGDIVLCFPGFGAVEGASEANLPSAYTATAAVEFPLGTSPQPVTFGGGRSVTIQPGPELAQSDPLPIRIPAGARFAVKSYLTWPAPPFWLGGNLASMQAGAEWTVRGTGLTDHTLDLTPFASTTPGLGWGPIVQATPLQRVAAIGVIGDSIAAGASDLPDPASFGMGLVRGLRGMVPVIDLGVGGQTMTAYLAQHRGQARVLQGAITHLVMQLGVNDLSAGASFPHLQDGFQRIVEPFLAAGVKVFGWTVTPHAKGSDGFLTRANQAPISVTAERERQRFNAWLRGSAAGLAGVIDAARAVDPDDTGTWGADAGASVSARVAQAAGYAVLRGGAVASVAPGEGLQSGRTIGGGYPAGASVPWSGVPYPGEAGGGATGAATADATGRLTAWRVDAGGSGYSAPPLVNLLGPWTMDGLHPSVRGFNEIICRTSYGPGLFN